MRKRQRPLPLFISHPFPTLSSSLQTPKCSLQSPANLLTTTMGAVAGALLFLHPTPALALTEPQKLVAEAWRIVDQSFVDRTFNHQNWFKIRMRAVKASYASMDDAYKAIRGMLSLLDDPYTRFLTPQQFTSLTSAATGEVAGVGVEMFPARVDDAIKVTSAIDDSPAARAGIRALDSITLIDGETTELLTPDEAAARIRGRPGTMVSLTVVHEGGVEEEMRLRRESLKVRSVKVERWEDGVVYVKIKTFNSGTAGDLREMLGKVGGVEKVVLDLRNNPGGYFPAGVDVARLFLKERVPVVFVVDKGGVPDEIGTFEGGGWKDVEVVVLVNGGTASASEILAGALRDNGRGVLVGERTFGKGVVQTVSGLSDGSGVVVTVARYETPGRVDINKVGISPDFEVVCGGERDVRECIPKEAW